MLESSVDGCPIAGPGLALLEPPSGPRTAAPAWLGKVLGGLAWCGRWARGLPGLMLRAPRLELVPYLTFLLLLSFAPGFTYHYVLVVLLCMGGTVYRPLLRMPVFWLALAVVQGMGVYLTWYYADNHKYLMAYWCLALACVQAAPAARRDAILAVNARLLLGLCMALATAYKALTPSFVDGTFFRYTLLTDGRFQYFSSAAAGVPLETHVQVRQLQKVMAGAYVHGVHLESIPLPDSARLRAVAAAMTWWTLAIEGALALAFLWPGHCRALRRVRHGLLLLFLFTTYAIAPVVPFGWLLVILGVAQAPPSRRLRAAYLSAFVLILAYLLPYQRALHGLFFSAHAG